MKFDKQFDYSRHCIDANYLNDRFVKINYDVEKESFKTFVKELAGRSRSDDIFQQIIDQIENPNFQTIVQNVNDDETFLKKYMKFAYVNDAEHTNIEYGNDRVDYIRYYDILTFFIISSKDTPLNLDDADDLKIWTDFRAEIQEGKVLLNSFQQNGIYQRLLSGASELEDIGLLNIVRYYNWLEDIRDFFNAHYANNDANGKEFDLLDQDQPLILMGSSGVGGFNRSLAFAAEDIGKDVYYNTDDKKDVDNKKVTAKTAGPAVLNFCTNLNKAFQTTQVRAPQSHDWSCIKSKKQILHINVCQSSWDTRYRSSICTIRLINKLVENANKKGKTLAILDLRVPHHVHRDNANPSLKQDKNCSDKYDEHFNNGTLTSVYKTCQQDIIKTDDLFKILNASKIIRFGNTGYRYYDASNMQDLIDQLKTLSNDGYPIETVYDK